MKKRKVNLPGSSAGLVRYFDEYKAAIRLKPEYILAGIVVIIVLEIVLKRALPVL